MNRMFSATMLIAFLGLVALLIPSYATQTKILLFPKITEVLPGDSFTIDISVSDVNELSGWQVALKYNGTIINCTSVWIPENHVFTGKTYVSTTASLNTPTVDGYNYTFFGSLLLTESVNVTKGLLFRLNFTAQTYGLTQLEIATKENPARFGNILYETDFYCILLNPDEQEMPYAVENGSIEVGNRQTLILTTSDAGTTDPSPGNYTYTYGESVPVTAIPNAHYTLDYWLLDRHNAGAANPIVVLMTENHTLQPVFARGNFTLTIPDAVGGSTSPPPGTYTFTAGEFFQVTATAGGGYRFDHWVLDDSSTVLDNPITLSMNRNHTLVAIFSEVHYTRTIYIRPNGAVDPPDVPIFNHDNVTYTLTGTISDSIIVVQRSNITVNGNGHILQGGGSGEGFSLYGINNVTIENITIRGFDRGVCLFGSSRNVISGNNITGNKWLGIALHYSSNNTIIQNNLTANNDAGIRLEHSSAWNTIVGNNVVANKWLGVYIDSSSNNSIHHNNWVNNKNQAYVANDSYQCANIWDDGFEGNFWSDYACIDSDSDGIGDASFTLNENNIDHYPLTGTFQAFRTLAGCSVNIISNSTIASFQYSEVDRKISFNVKGPDGTTGHCKVVIVHSLMDVNRIQILIDEGKNEVLNPNYNLHDNNTHRWIYFSYRHSTHKVTIQEDITPPAILVVSPENRIYPANSVSLAFMMDESTAWIGYSLDGAANVTVKNNVTLTNLIDGLHSLVVYANDTVGNMGSSITVLFTVDATPPNITAVTQMPNSSNVTFEDRVYVNATVTDDLSKVKNVTLIYSCANVTGAWNGTVEMTNFVGEIWGGAIPAFPYGTNVTYMIVAEDNAGHTATSEDMGFECQYQVVSEFPSLLILYLFMIALLIIVSRRLRKGLLT